MPKKGPLAPLRPPQLSAPDPLWPHQWYLCRWQRCSKPSAHWALWRMPAARHSGGLARVVTVPQGLCRKPDPRAGITQREEAGILCLAASGWVGAPSPTGLHRRLTSVKAFDLAVPGTGKVSEQREHQAKPVCRWKEPSTSLLGAYPGPSLKTVRCFYRMLLRGGAVLLYREET